ncbi:Xanthine dehydrogenase [Neolecta irregularis DAH-3]|uniref:xanthine dehydrogenase n=1 Tax=Neolecta irregularis (strain DAH-3) TaxID=1198029 RepID=A0A1U7LTE3_NEOID|nr:Xanthine dehydrogenase [Neolecta irregularis DAH-3]|eukprot:OLL25899.1 Xanthine dehydrogenase [Neolecta irregularis DAH-3]
MSLADIQKLKTIASDYDDALIFYLNGTRIELENADPEATLLEYLRGIGLTGTKLGCAEGGCGINMRVEYRVGMQVWGNFGAQPYVVSDKLINSHISVNACLAPLVSVDGKHVITVEGIGNSSDPHPVQERLAKMHGSQCGFCTPGIVMSLYALLRNSYNPTEEEIEGCLDGNLCRCTGYRPILDAARTFINKSKESECHHMTQNSFHKNCEKEEQSPVSSDPSTESTSIDIPNGQRTGCGKKDCCKLNLKQPSTDVYAQPSFKSYDPSTELIFPPALKKFPLRPLSFGNKRKQWFRPVTLHQLLQLKATIPSAKLTSGSSEIQIEIKFKAMRYAVSIYIGDIPELRAWKYYDEFLEIGGNISLSTFEHVLKGATQHYKPEYCEPFTALLHQLRYFSGQQIRNVATPAGNIATASPISDLNPVFVATNSILTSTTLLSTNSLKMTEFFKGYRTTALAPGAVISSIRIPISRSREFVRAYKQAKRRDDDIAIVNTGMRVRLSEKNIVEEISLAYGGMGPTTMQARNAMASLLSKRWGDEDVLQKAYDGLEQDFPLSFGVPGGMSVYRKALALSFFFRFWCDVAKSVGLYEWDNDGIDEIEREISKGSADLPSPYENEIVGRGDPHIAALQQSTGEAQYTDDIPRLWNELYGAIVMSTKAHAKILSVEYQSALELPGVKAWIDKNDLPDAQSNWWGAPNCDEVFFAEDEVFCAGQPIGLVLADTQAQAQDAARAVKIVYEDLPAIFTIEEAIEKESFFPHYRFIRRGAQINEALAKSDIVIEGVSRMGGQEHFYLETQVSLVVPGPEDGEMHVYASTQNPTETQTFVSQVTNTPANRIVCHVRRLGGGFGGKETRSIQLSSILAVAAKKLKRPVRCMLNRDEDAIMSGQRHPFLARWKVGVSKEGKLLALDADVFNNGGWSQDLSGAVLERALSHIDNCYWIPNVDVRGRIAKTNIHSNTAFRGFGGPQGMFITECFMSDIADRIGVSVDKLREINLYEEGQKHQFHPADKYWHVPIMYQQMKEEVNYEARRNSVDKFNRSHRYKKRGISLIPTKFGISFTALFLNQAGALVHIYHDGSILVSHGGTEMGQGLHTKMCMIAAQELNVPLDQIHISETSTDKVANTSSTAASASSDLNGMAIKNACDQINERLKPYRERLGPEATMKALAQAAYFDRVNLSANGHMHFLIDRVNI